MAFRFKQFYIDDTDCAMKVGTDGILLGSWSQLASRQVNKPIRRVLDIGAGSGLLSLMAAQKLASELDVDVTGIELDKAAAAQAKNNVANSPWPERVEIKQADIRTFSLTQQAEFDWILANPPYFDPGQRFSKQREQARHTGTLNWHELINAISLLLKPSACFECIIPFSDREYMIALALQSQLQLISALAVKSTPDKVPFRSLLRFQYQPALGHLAQAEWQNVVKDSEQLELVIRDRENRYTEEYKSLCRDFYLAF